MSGQKIIDGLREALAGWSIGPTDIDSHACNCIGPQNGEPVCPCRMRYLHQKDGRWVEVIDHGPVRPAPPSSTTQTEES